MRKVKDRHIVVIGAARSGVPAARLLQAKGANVFVTDNGKIPGNFKQQLVENDIAFEENGHSKKAEAGDFAVLSPGVPTEAPLVQHYLDADKEVFSEIEMACWFNQGPIVAVTGSNGKTTVTNWLDHTWKQAGKNHFTGGNVGKAFSVGLMNSSTGRDNLLEVSSFQLDHIDTFHPNVSLLLNITPDHLDRYDNDFEKYAAAKFRITKNQTTDDWMIYHQDDPVISRHVQSLQQKKKCATTTCFFINRKSAAGRVCA